jgi:hypothetical protein
MGKTRGSLENTVARGQISELCFHAAIPQRHVFIPLTAHHTKSPSRGGEDEPPLLGREGLPALLISALTCTSPVETYREVRVIALTYQGGRTWPNCTPLPAAGKPAAWEKQVLSARGFKPVGRRSEHAMQTAWRCVRRCPWGSRRGPGGSSEPPESPICFSPPAASSWSMTSTAVSAPPSR